VVGLASQEPEGKQQWLLSAKRADVVANFIRNNMPPDSQWSIYSWEQGTGGDLGHERQHYGRTIDFYRHCEGKITLAIVSSFSTFRRFFGFGPPSVALLSAY